jgi:hypothetical protein
MLCLKKEEEWTAIIQERLGPEPEDEMGSTFNESVRTP